MRDRPDVDAAFCFGPFRLIPSQQLVLRDGRTVKLGCRALDILYMLIMRAGEEVSKQDLIAFVWPNVTVDRQNLKVHISSLRRALGDTLPEPTYIATVVGRGYKFVGRVHMERIAIAEFSGTDLNVEHTLPLCPILVGRQHEIESLAQALDFARLVTLVGTGGVGKTVLATVVAHTKRRVFPDGIYFANLSTVNDHALVPHVIARCVGIQGDPPDLGSALVEHLQDRRALIVIDSCEHVLSAVALIATRLVEAKVNSCLLATSRESLGIRTERVQRVQSLAFPRGELVQGASEALAYPSIELFSLRAFEAVGYQINDVDAPIIAMLCETLDGLPLAIEIAAAKMDQFSASELLHSVSRDFRALKNEDINAHSRHQTLWATLDWSYRLLSIEESAIFRLLSVFVGSFELSDVAYMARLIAYDPYQTTIALGGLVARSLLAATTCEDQLCYRMLDSARSYATEALSKDPITDKADRHHAQLMLTVMERSKIELGSLEPSAWRARYGKWIGDLHKALDWSFSDKGDRSVGINLALAAIPFWDAQSFLNEQLSQVERALRYCGSSEDWVRPRATLAMSRAFSLTYTKRPCAEKEDAWSAAVTLSELSGGTAQHVAAMQGKAVFLVWTGRLEQALNLSSYVVRLAAKAGDRTMVVQGERLHCVLEIFRGDIVKALNKLEQLEKDVALNARHSKLVIYHAHGEVSFHAWIAFSMWLTGESERAFEIVEQLVLKTTLTNHLMAQTALLVTVAMPIAFWGGKLEALTRYVDILRWNIENRNVSIFEPYYRFYASVIRHSKGDPGAVCEMRAAIESLIQDQLLLRVPIYLSALAESLLENGNKSNAEKVIESAISLQKELNEMWCLPELLRVKARILSALGNHRSARLMLASGIENALSIGARSFEIRLLRDMNQLLPLDQAALDSERIS